MQTTFFILLSYFILIARPILIDFEASEVEFENQWGGSYFNIVENPDISENNNSKYVGNVYKYGKQVSPFSGISTDLLGDVSWAKKISLKVYSESNDPFYLLLKLENTDFRGGSFPEYKKTVISKKEWVTVSFDIKKLDLDKLDRISLFFDFGETEEKDFYFDDLKIE